MHTQAKLLAPPLLTIHIRYSLSPMQACIKKRNYFGIICTSYFYRIDLEFKPPTKIDVSSAVYHASLRH